MSGPERPPTDAPTQVVPVAPGVAKLSKSQLAVRAFFFPGLAYVVPCSAAWILIVSLVTITNKPLRQGLHDQVGRCVVVVRH